MENSDETLAVLNSEKFRMAVAHALLECHSEKARDRLEAGAWRDMADPVAIIADLTDPLARKLTEWRRRKARRWFTWT